MDKYESLARRWMLGTRHGRPGQPSRAAAEHPADLVRVIAVEATFAPPADDYRTELTPIAWLHDIVEDGIKEDGTRVTLLDLASAGVPGSIVLDVDALSQRENELKPEYLSRLSVASQRARMVKAIDRICNLREGSGTFKDARWARYVDETNLYIIPLVTDLPDPFRSWAEAQLRAAIVSRPV